MIENNIEDASNNKDIMINECENMLKSFSSKANKDINIKKQNARNRWKLLARAILSESKREQTMIKKLTTTPISSIIRNVSQNFDGFEFVKIEQLKKDEKNKFSIKIDVGSKRYECNVHLEKLWTIKDLIGFNNTGNITFWTSEAALCHYAMENISMFDRSWIIEIGGGMLCLAGILIGRYSNAYAVHLTDGNESSLKNVKKSVILNDFNCFMKCSVVRWEEKKCPFEKRKYNFVLCADCLFFDDSQLALVDSICYFLSTNGIAADYWKSQDRKFCDFCKCWLTDNKPSVDFHNNGKRHKANVQKRINDIGKKSDADRKAQNKLDEELRKINEAAMKSYTKDISGGLNAIGSALSKPVDPMALPYYYDEEDGPNIANKSNITAVTSNLEVTQSLWCEAVSDEGHVYYWNVKTNESVWEKPKEGYMSLDEYNKLNKIAVDKQEEERKKDLKYHVENAEELASKYKREQFKKYQKITQEPESTEAAGASSSSSSKTNYATENDINYRILGKWEKVDSAPEKEEKTIDLGLPKQNDVYYAIASVQSDEPPVKKFKEKTIVSLGMEDDQKASSVFIKRKIGKRNIRKANDS